MAKSILYCTSATRIDAAKKKLQELRNKITTKGDRYNKEFKSASLCSYSKDYGTDENGISGYYTYAKIRLFYK